MGQVNVLVFPGGTEIGLEVRQALAYCREVTVHSAADADSNHAPFAYRNHHIVPGVNTESWLDRLQEVIALHDIHFIFGCHEDVLLELVRNQGRLNAQVVASPLEVMETVRSKRCTYESLAAVVRTPTVHDAGSPNLPFPVFVKPDRGAGSRGARLVRSQSELLQSVAVDEDMIVSEWVPGTEMTVDCFSDRELGLLFCQPRVRVRMRSGISMDSYTVADPRAEDMARAISGALALRGAWFFQVREAIDGQLVLLEIGARIAGTMAVSRCSGVNLPLLSIYEMQRRPISIMQNELKVHVDRALVNRYTNELAYDTVYVDLDDTLILGDEVNSALVAYLYQSINRGRRVVILTRHAGDPHETLRRHRLGQVADAVHHLTPDQSKAEFIESGAAILIDDSFGERRDVHDRTGIHTFDCSMLEMLLDDRV